MIGFLPLVPLVPLSCLPPSYVVEFVLDGHVHGSIHGTDHLVLLPLVEGDIEYVFVLSGSALHISWFSSVTLDRIVVSMSEAYK